MTRTPAMTDSASDHPFKPGAEVAICISGGFNTPMRYRKSIVTKVLGSGKFRVEGTDVQWRAYPPGYEKHWSAHAAGSRDGTLVILDDTTAAMVAERNARFKRHQRYADVRYKLDRLPFSDRVTDDVLDNLEKALSALQEPAQ